MDQSWTEATDKARELGTEHGRNAASWATDGNTDQATYAYLLQGIKDGDPMVLDQLPAPDLSGQWADGYMPRQLFEDATGNDAHAEATWNQDAYQDALTELCDAYEEAFSQAAEDEIVRVCLRQLGA